MCVTLSALDRANSNTLLKLVAWWQFQMSLAPLSSQYWVQNMSLWKIESGSSTVCPDIVSQGLVCCNILVTLKIYKGTATHCIVHHELSSRTSKVRMTKNWSQSLWPEMSLEQRIWATKTNTPTKTNTKTKTDCYLLNQKCPWNKESGRQRQIHRQRQTQRQKLIVIS